MYNPEDQKCNPAIPPGQPEDMRASQVRDRDMGGMRALTAVEMQQIEHKHAEEMNYLLRSFIAFPTPQNFQAFQTSAGQYMQAWMNGRRRILD